MPGGVQTLRSRSYLFLLVVLVLGLISGFAYKVTHYKMGLDVRGGVRLVYQMDLKDKQQPREGDQARLVSIMSRRAGGDLGVQEPQVLPKGVDQIIVELPDIQNIEEAKKVMGTSARIEFYWAKNVVTKEQSIRPYSETSSEKNSSHPSVAFERVGTNLPPIKFRDPGYQDIIKGWELILSGDELKSAEYAPAGDNMYKPTMTFSDKGAEKMEKWTRAHMNRGEKLAAVLDGEVLSINPVQDNTILSNNAVIEGQFTAEYVKSLTNMLNSGALPVNLTLISSNKVDATIGAHALDKIVSAGIVAFAVISVLLIAYYAFPGFVAFIALCLYVLFSLTVMKLINTTFSLAGIAGFILSVGMAVDANILVFERFKEEVQHGKSLHAAIQLGFRRALPAIIDSNACTILTSLVLANIGTGPVKGFATTLIIGVIVSLFTAVSVTRSLLFFFIDSGIATNESWFALNRNWFGKRLGSEASSNPLRVVEKSTKWFVISAVTMVISIPFFFMGGFKPNVEFQGGYEATFKLNDSNITTAQVSENLEKAGLKGGNVQLSTVSAGTSKDKNGNTIQVPEHRAAIISLPLQKSLTGDSAKDLKTIADAAGIPEDPDAQFTQIGATVQKETQQNAFIGVLVSAGLIILYLAFRFGIGVGGFAAGLRFGVSAIGALLHDILVVFGSAAIVGFFFHWQVSALFLTAMLTMIGFSVHDTIVIFDRIRENLHRPLKNENFGDLIDRSITQSFARSINTSMTVIITLLILVVAGTATSELKFFVVAMLIGIISGTYSSIYNASPILYLWDKAIAAKKPENTLVALARGDLARQQVIQTRASTVTPEVVPDAPQAPSGRTYGQVRRRANSSPRSHGIEIEDED